MSANKTVPEPWRSAVMEYVQYLEAMGYSPETVKTRRCVISRFARTCGTTPNDVQTNGLIAYLSKCQSLATKKVAKNTFSSFFKWYCDIEKRRTGNPAAILPSIRKSRPHPMPCPDEAIYAALDNATDCERIMILLAAECGLRRNEIACVHSRDVIPEPGGHKALIVHGKGDKQRIVPLPDDLAKAIMQSDGYVFPGRFGGHVEASYIGKHITRLLPDGYSAHKLRHRFATVSYSQSHDILAVSKALGHASTETTMNYTALPDERLRSLVDSASLWHQYEQSDCMATETANPRSITAPRHPANVKRSENGKIRYLTDGIHGTKGLAGRQKDAVRSALMLCLELLIERPNVSGMSFCYSADMLADKWHIQAKGYARRSTPVRAGARRLQDDRLIELASDHHGMLRGNIIADVDVFATELGKLSDEWACLHGDD